MDSVSSLCLLFHPSIFQKIINSIIVCCHSLFFSSVLRRSMRSWRSCRDKRSRKKRAVICPASHSSRLPPAPAVLSFPRTRESRKQKITRLNGYRTSARGACLLLLGYSLLLFPPARVEKLTSLDYPRKIKNGEYGTTPHAVLSSRRYRCWARKSERASRTGSTS